MPVLVPTPAEDAVLARLGPDHRAPSQMTDGERAFLNALVLRTRPAKALEIGVAAGSSSAVLAHAALAADPGAHVYAIDYSVRHYMEPDRETGYVMAAYPALAARWRLFAGGLACRFLEAVGGDVDFLLLDTRHLLPGEILDFLMALPFLRDGAVVCLHDVAAHALCTDGRDPEPELVACGLLLSALPGEKFRLPDFDRPRTFALPAGWSHTQYFPNIGAVRLAPDVRDRVEDLFHLLTLEWGYYPSDADFAAMRAWFARFYGEGVARLFDRIGAFQQARAAERTAAFRRDGRQRRRLAAYRLLGHWAPLGRWRRRYSRAYWDLRGAREFAPRHYTAGEPAG